MSGGWPWPGDNELTRARKVAMAYRTALGANNRELRDEIDRSLAEVGQTWMLDVVATVEPDGLDEVTTAQAAELAHVPPHRIRAWAVEQHPTDPGRALLPRFGRRGKQTTYLVRDVHAAALIKRGSVGLPPLAPRHPD